MTCRTAIRCMLALVTTLLLSVSANAQLFRAYLAPSGSDANSCTLAAPCRLLPAALAAVADGGEIWILDSANYNTATVTIGKSVSILAVPGVVGSVVATGGPAMSITASALKVALRNLVIVPLPGGGGTSGIEMTGASTLTIEDSLLANLPTNAVIVTGTGKLRIANSVIRDNGIFAVYVLDGATAEISGTRMLGNAGGAVIVSSHTAATTTGSVSDSIVSGGQFGVSAGASTSASAIAYAFVTRCTIEGTTFAALDSENYGNSAVVTVSSSMITNNTAAWYIAGSGAVIETLGNNHIAHNAASYGALTPIAQK